MKAEIKIFKMFINRPITKVIPLHIVVLEVTSK